MPVLSRPSGLLIQLSLRDLMNESSRMTGAGWCQTSISRIIVISLWNSYKSEELTRNDQPYLYLILALRNPIFSTYRGFALFEGQLRRRHSFFPHPPMREHSACSDRRVP